jgi:hypothetical protein
MLDEVARMKNFIYKFWLILFLLSGVAIATIGIIFTGSK